MNKASIEELDIKSIIQDSNIIWDKFNNTSVLITGATGLLGSLIVKVLYLSNYNIRIYALVRDVNKGKKVLENKAILIEGDVQKVILPEFHVDYIFHCAAITESKYMVSNPVETLAVAIKGLENILEFAKKQGVKGVLYLSSMEAYGCTALEQNPVKEDTLGFIDLFNPRSSYSEGKRVCELMCNAYYIEYDVPVKIARLAQTFGAGVPLTDNRVFMQFARAVLNNKDIILHTKGNSVLNFCYTTDAIRALFTILTKGDNGQVYNVCNDMESRTITEIADLVSNTIAEGKIKVIYDIPSDNIYGYAPDVVMHLCSDKLHNIGWTPRVGMKEAYERLIDYLREL